MCSLHFTSPVDDFEMVLLLSFHRWRLLRCFVCPRRAAHDRKRSSRRRRTVYNKEIRNMVMYWHGRTERGGNKKEMKVTWHSLDRSPSPVDNALDIGIYPFVFSSCMRGNEISWPNRMHRNYSWGTFWCFHLRWVEGRSFWIKLI